MFPTEGEPPGEHLPTSVDNPPPAAEATISPVPHLDDVAKSLKIPEQSQLAHPLATEQATKPADALGRIKRSRSGGNLEDDTSAAELLLGIGTKSEGGSGDSKGGVQGTAAKATAAAAAAAASKAKAKDAKVTDASNSGGGTGGAAIRRSSRRGPTSGVNYAVAAALAAENSSSDEEIQPVAPSSSRRGGARNGRPSAVSSREREKAASVVVKEEAHALPTIKTEDNTTTAPTVTAVDSIVNASSIEATANAAAAAAAATSLNIAPISNSDLAAVMNMSHGGFLPPLTGASAPPPAPALPTTESAPSGVGPASVGLVDPNAVQKSELTLLCERFQYQFGHLQPDGGPTLLMLNDVAEALGVPRRRLYDVINVFEAIEVMKRVGKLMYEFCGYDHLPALLEKLHSDEMNGLPVEDRVRWAPAAVAAAHAAAAAAAAAVVAEGGDAATAAAAAAAVEQSNPGQDPPPRGQPGRSSSHSLWVLSRRLVRMILRTDVPVSLTGAAAELVGPGGVADPSQHRTQTQITVERRLYDIGSILCSLGLVERIYLKKRQPAFAWIYGWRPGNTHQPPELAVATMSRQPAPPLALIPRRPEDGGTRQGRRGGRGGGKRQKLEEEESAAQAAQATAAQAAAFQSLGNPFAFNAFTMPGLGGFPAMGGLPGLDPAAAAAGGVGGDKSTQLAFSQYMNSPAFLMSMGLGMMPGTDMSTMGVGGAPGSGAVPGQDGSVNANVSGVGVGNGNSFPPMPGVDMAAMAAAFAADPQQQLQLQQQMQSMPKVEGDAGQQLQLQQQQQPPGGNGVATTTAAMDPATMTAFDPMSAAMMSAMWGQPQMMMNPAMMQQFQQQAAAAAFAGQQQQQQGGSETKDGGVNGAGQGGDSTAPDTTATNTATADKKGVGADAQGNEGGTEDENAATMAAAAAAAAAQFQMYGGMLLPGVMPGSGMGAPMAGEQQKQQQQEEEGAGGGAENGNKDTAAGADAAVKTK